MCLIYSWISYQILCNSQLTMLKYTFLNCLLVLYLDSSESLTHHSNVSANKEQHNDDIEGKIIYLESSESLTRNSSASLIYRSKVSPKKEKQKEDDMEGKIVGGKPIPLERVPYSVQIFNLGSMCAGTILNGWTLLTAAHCFDLNKDVNEIVVHVGSRFVYDFNANQYYVSDIIIHKDYNKSGIFACDIALVFLERHIEFSKVAQKTVLVNHKRWMNPNQTNFVVTGWGWTEYGGEVSKDGLMMTNLRFVPKPRCNQLHKMNLSADMFCLYGGGTSDTCKGDSGGGVFWHGMMVGITSHGDGCAKVSKPSVYANVEYFREWIKYQVTYYLRTNCRNINKPSKTKQAEDYFYDDTSITETT